MGQKQGKSPRRHEADGDTPPSPVKSPKRDGGSSRSPSREPSPAKTPTRLEAKKFDIKDKESPLVPKTSAVSETTPVKSSSPGKRLPKEQEEVKEQIEPVSQKHVEASPRTPVKFSNGKEREPLTPITVNDISNHIPQATSTPAAHNGIGGSSSQASSPPLSPSDDEQTDQSDDEAFTSDRQLRQSPSTNGSLNSQSTTSSIRRLQLDSSFERRVDVNFGKFYTTSYLKNGSPSYLKRASLNPKSDQKSPHYHRPMNFSYSKETPSFLQNKKSGMTQLVAGKVVVKKTRRSSSPDLKNEEAVRLSSFPSAMPPKPNEITKIERDDWPGPPSPAAILPEILRQRRKSRGEKDEDEEEEVVEENPKIRREIEELSKFKDESGMGKVICQELEVRKAQPTKALDPWKASRAPAADHEPQFHTRYQSPMFASPSRFLDQYKRSWDDGDIRGYRTISNFPVPKPGYGEYGLTPRAATLPLAGEYGGHLHLGYYNLEKEPPHQGVPRQERSTYTSTSTVNTETSSKRESRRDSGTYDGPSVSLMTFQKNTWHTEAAPPVYEYELLKISHFNLPKDVDRNRLEIYLSPDEFDSIFRMSKEDFYRLAEWKRNDMKKRVDLY